MQDLSLKSVIFKEIKEPLLEIYLPLELQIWDSQKLVIKVVKFTKAMDKLIYANLKIQ